jgi:hypothetical protein
MKVVVLIPFCDKYTGKNYKKGDIIEVTAKRFNEIVAKGKYIQPVEEEKPVKA